MKTIWETACGFFAQSAEDAEVRHRITDTLGISAEDIATFCIGYARSGLREHLRAAGYSEREIDANRLLEMREQIIFPLRDIHSELLGMRGLRADSAQGAGYMTVRSPKADRADLFFGTMPPSNTLVLCEEPRAVLRMYKTGCHAVATPVRPLIEESQLLADETVQALQKRYAHILIL